MLQLSYSEDPQTTPYKLLKTTELNSTRENIL